MKSLPRRLLPSTSALAAFEAVARLGSFTAAAHELSLTQGAISRQIVALETLLGRPLFARGRRGVALTAEGAAYARRITEALSIIRTASLDVMTKRHGNTLNLAVTPTFGTRWLMPRMRGFLDRHPEITLNFVNRIGQFDFAVEGIDAAIHIGASDWPGAECMLLMHETVAPLCSPAFLGDHAIGGAADLGRLPLLHMASRPGAWEHWFDSLGLAPPPAQGMRFDQFAAVAQAAIAGIGVALLPLFLVRQELEAGQLVKAVDHPIRSRSSYYLVTPRSKPVEGSVAQFRQWLLAEIEAFLQSDDAP
ncbi:LysR family transcriptional regulator [Mesorhizobium xinjiangense]|uniref:LysR family transcriptional regulator n=1 Tax=Mesorhizobium xinjiangense TaxID=2678685 RepID=UPI0012EDE16C|nr:LysR family transcriptional regulator [Mesorhizobium xinjiangense]